MYVLYWLWYVLHTHTRKQKALVLLITVLARERVEHLLFLTWCEMSVAASEAASFAIAAS